MEMFGLWYSFTYDIERPVRLILKRNRGQKKSVSDLRRRVTVTVTY